MKKILVVDDSALMRKIFSDVLKDDGRFEVAGLAKDGVEALELLSNTKFDAIVLDINMPKMNGIEFMEELKRKNKKEKIVIVSTDAADGAEITIRALELGAFDFIQKPKNTLDAKQGDFKQTFIRLVYAAADAKEHNVKSIVKEEAPAKLDDRLIETVRKKSTGTTKKIVAIASSTGGPNALQRVIPFLPGDLDAPVMIVQHMPAGFTNSLAERLDTLSKLSVKEAKEGDQITKGNVYIAKGGQHMKYSKDRGAGHIVLSDEPPREGVKPCANYMFESLVDSDYDEIVCVVLTGMGADGTAGIKELKKKKKVHVIAQEEHSCVVYGMPKAVVNNGLQNQIVELDKIAQEIVMCTGVK